MTTKFSLFSLALAPLALMGGAGAALAEVPAVLTDLPVTQSLVAQVMGDLGTPELLLERGGDPHHAALRPSQARALSRAGLVVWISEGMTPWLEGPVETLATGTVLELGEVAGVHKRPFGTVSALGAEAADDGHDHDHEADEDHDHDHDHDHEAEADHDHDEHAEEGHAHSHSADATDPHMWLDPDNAEVWLRAIAAELSAIDPGNAATYAANAEAAVAGVDALEDEIEAMLEPAEHVGIVTFHAAYGYFAEAFDLDILGTVALGDASAPGAARLSALRAELAGHPGACLFPEANHPNDYTDVIAEGGGMRVGAPLDPAGVMLEPGPGLYAATLRGLAQAIADCAASQ